MLTAITNSGAVLAVPSIAEEFPASAVQLSWIPTIFVMTNVILILPFGRLADRIGLKRIYLAGIVTFSVASFVATLGDSMAWVIAMRGCQAVGTAMMQACGMAIVGSVFADQQRGTAVGIAASCLYFGLSVGPLLGGELTDAFGWRSVFYFPMVFAGLVCGVIVLRLRGEWRSDEPLTFDWLGLLLFATTIVCIMIGVSSLPAGGRVGLIAVGVVTGIAFVRSQWVRPNPMLRIRAIVDNRVFRQAVMAQMAMYCAIYAVIYLMSLYLQYIKAVGAGEAGRILIFQALLMAVTAPLAGRAADRFSARILSTAGSLLAALGYFGLCWIGDDTAFGFIMLCLSLIGVGMGLFSTPNYKAALAAVPSDRLASATAVMNSARNLGNIAGMAIVLSLIALMVGGEAIAPPSYARFLIAVQCAFAVSCASALWAAWIGSRRVD